MATKSFSKRVEIKDKRLGADFANALEDVLVKSTNKSEVSRPMSRECKELKGEEIIDFLNM